MALATFLTTRASARAEFLSRAPIYTAPERARGRRWKPGEGVPNSMLEAMAVGCLASLQHDHTVEIRKAIDNQLVVSLVGETRRSMTARSRRRALLDWNEPARRISAASREKPALGQSLKISTQQRAQAIAGATERGKSSPRRLPPLAGGAHLPARSSLSEMQTAKHNCASCIADSLEPERGGKRVPQTFCASDHKPLRVDNSAVATVNRVGQSISEKFSPNETVHTRRFRGRRGDQSHLARRRSGIRPKKGALAGDHGPGHRTPYRQHTTCFSRPPSSAK
jgi:hypothetical protein